MVATQALRNVVDRERWSNVSVETIRYFLGHYGDPSAPVDPGIADRVLSRPGVDELRHLEPIHLEGARARFGKRISDEELLLRLTMPEEQVDAMVAGRRTAPAVPSPESNAATRLLREVARREAVQHIRVETADRVVEWRRA
jgi:oxaloacetate decarboxylase alpha subunit